VREAVHLAEPEIRHHAIRLDLHLAPRPLPVEVDRIQVEQVVLNLVRNAVEAMSGAEDADARDLAIATELHDDGDVGVHVRDTGIGLPEHAGTTIFDLRHRKANGLGLGLSISRSIVRHGGSLWARRNAGRGARSASRCRRRRDSRACPGNRSARRATMQISMNLPSWCRVSTAVPFRWARRIDAGPFATLAVGEPQLRT
jgi:C4-dicarboxylate-specific signal transduction histidine kinase